MNRHSVTPRSWVICVSFLAVVTIFSGLLQTEAQAEPSDDEILNAVDLARGDSLGIHWNIAVVAKEGGKTTENKLMVSNRAGSFLANYIAPARVKGQKLLKSGRNMWFVKPGVSKAVPISPRQRLLGDASYGDLASTTFAVSYTPTRLDDAKGNYVFDLVAREKGQTYDRLKLWVDKDKLYGVKAEYYSLEGKLLKTATFEYKNKVSRPGGKHPNMISKMTLESGDDVTTLTYSGVTLKGVSWDLFDLSNVMEE